MPERICELCGTKFTTSSSRRKICYNKHFNTCKICGKEFEITYSTRYKQVCSNTCRKKLISKSSKMLEPKYSCICSICGCTFLSHSKNSRICYEDHKVTCAYCGKIFLPSREQLLHGKKTCSFECNRKLSGQSFSKSCGNAADYDSKIKYLNRYKATVQSKYGVDNPMKCERFKDKVKNTCLEKYGQTSFTKTKQFRSKCIETNRIKYGVDWESQTDKHKQSVRETCLKKYGVDNPAKSSNQIESKMSDSTMSDNWISFREAPIKFLSEHFEKKPSANQVSSICGVTDYSVTDYLLRSGFSDVLNHKYSKMEDEVVDFIYSIDPEIQILRNDRVIIAPYELDIYLPEYNFAIECNPTCSHNSTTCMFPKDDDPKPIRYHMMKTDLCENKNVNLFHIFGHEWTHKKEIIQSMIRNKLGHTINIVHGRKTEVVELDNSTSVNFLNKNHRQGGVTSSIRLGLRYKDELVAVMTFSKMRNTIGTSPNENTSNCYELVRFCNKLDTSVIGGASKLFKYFVVKYHPEEIRSFSDRSHTSGNLYRILGFKQERISDPGYVWVNVKTDVAYNRLNAQKRNIQKFLHDDSIDLSQSESQIMTSYGFVKVYDSGTILWDWKY